jgi:hypothetical protein
MMNHLENELNSNKEVIKNRLSKEVRSRSTELLNVTKHDKPNDLKNDMFKQPDPFLTQRLKSNQNVFDLKLNYENKSNRQKLKQISLSHSNLLDIDGQSKAEPNPNDHKQRDDEAFGTQNSKDTILNQTNRKESLVDSVFLARTRLSSSNLSSSSNSSSSLSSLSSVPLSQTSSSNSHSNSNVSLFLKQQQQQQQISTHKNNNKDKPELSKVLMNNKRVLTNFNNNKNNKNVLSHFQTTKIEDKAISATTKMNELDEIKTGVVRDLCKKFCSIEENPARKQQQHQQHQNNSNLFFYYHFNPPHSAHQQQTSTSNRLTATTQTKVSNEQNSPAKLNSSKLSSDQSLFKKPNKLNELNLDNKIKMNKPTANVDQSLQQEKQSDLSKSSSCLNDSTSSSCSIDSNSMSNSTMSTPFSTNQSETSHKNKLPDSNLFENVRIKERIDRFTGRPISNDSSSQLINASVTSVVSIKPNLFQRRLSSAKILTFLNERKSSSFLSSNFSDSERNDSKSVENLGDERLSNTYANIQRNDEYFVVNEDSPNSTFSDETNGTLKRPDSTSSNSNLTALKERSKSLSNLKLRQQSEQLNGGNRQYSIDLQQKVLSRANSFLFNAISFEKNYSKIKEAFVSELNFSFEILVQLNEKLFFQSDLREDSLIIENLLNDVRSKVKEASNFLILNEEIAEESVQLDEQQHQQQQLEQPKYQNLTHGSTFSTDFSPSSVNQAAVKQNTNESQTKLIRHKF